MAFIPPILEVHRNNLLVVGTTYPDSVYWRCACKDANKVLPVLGIIMHNIIITEHFDWPQTQPSRRIKFVNKILEKMGLWARLSPPLQTGVMTCVEQRINMYHLVTQVLVYDVPGEIVELGCNKGQSTVLFRKIMDHYNKGKELHVYDSFEGLPEAKPEDGDTKFRKGEMAVGEEALLANFKMIDAEPPIIHKGWFNDILPTGLPDKIAFAHLDGDFYDSIRVSLEHVYPRLSKGAVCLIDDYSDPDVYDGWNELPGVKKACDEYLKDKLEQVSVLYAGHYAHAYFHKL